MSGQVEADGDDFGSADFEIEFIDAAGSRCRGSSTEFWTVAFEEMPPVRGFGWSRGQKYFPGWHRHVGFESWLERDHAPPPMANQPIVQRSPQEIGEVGKAMGTWDVEPFGNDDTADFANDLDEASAQERIEMISSVLDRVANATDDDLRLADPPRHSDAIRAVAAAALVAAQCPGGAPVTSGYGPTTPMPQFPASLRILALNALDRVVAPSSWLAEYWDETPDGPAWRRTISELRKVFDPPQQESLFDL